MIIVGMAALVSLIALVVVYWRAGPDRARLADPHARRWRRLALWLLGLYGAFQVYMGVGEMIGGDYSGFIHLIPAALLGGLIFLASKRPRETGIALLLIGGLMSLYFAVAIHDDALARVVAVAVGGLPWVVAGVLLLVPEIDGYSDPHHPAGLGA